MKHTTIALLGVLSLVACERRDKNIGEESAEQTKNAGKKMSEEAKKADEKMSEEMKELGKGGGPGMDITRETGRDKLVNARCDRMRACGELTPGKMYDTLDSCVSKEKASLDGTWTMSDCPRIDHTRLDACVTATNSLTCDDLKNQTPDECSMSKVCMK